jgi:hypothetical protein
LSEKRNSFLRLLKNKGFQEERMTKVGLDAIGSSTTLESNKSLLRIHQQEQGRQEKATSGTDQSAKCADKDAHRD